MNNPFVELKKVRDVETTTDQVARKLAGKDRNQQRDALYARYTPVVYNVLDLLIAAYQPGIWKKGSDINHQYCCHCRWYAGPEETGRANYGDHAICRRIEIELDIDEQCVPTGFKILFHENHGKCIHVGLSQNELVRGIKAALY